MALELTFRRVLVPSCDLKVMSLEFIAMAPPGVSSPLIYVRESADLLMIAIAVLSSLMVTPSVVHSTLVDFYAS